MQNVARKEKELLEMQEVDKNWPSLNFCKTLRMPKALVEIINLKQKS